MAPSTARPSLSLMRIMSAALPSFAMAFSLAITAFSLAGNLLVLFSGYRSFKACCYDSSFSNILLRPLKLSYDFSQHPLYSCILLNSIVLAITVKCGLFPVDNSHNLHEEPSPHEPSVENFRNLHEEPSSHEPENSGDWQEEPSSHEPPVENSRNSHDEPSSPHEPLIDSVNDLGCMIMDSSYQQQEEESHEEEQEQYTPHEQLVPIEHNEEINDSQEEELSLEELNLRIESFLSRFRENMWFEARS